MNQEIQIQPKAGDILALNCNSFTHFALISDRIGSDGYPMLIGASERTGTVQEELWSDIIDGLRYEIIKNPGVLSAIEVLRNARLQIGEWSYSLLKNNCEHFVNVTSGLPKNSKQVISAVSWGVALACVTYALSENNSGWKALFALGVGAYIGTQLAR